MIIGIRQNREVTDLIHLLFTGTSIDSVRDLPQTIVDSIILFTQIGEDVAVPPIYLTEKKKEEEEQEPCCRIYLHAFRGARDDESVGKFKQSCKMHEENNTNGPGAVECLLYTGHVGISFNAESPIFGFNPDIGNEPGWAVINGLKQKNSKRKPYPGIVTDDTAVFYRAESDGLLYKKVEYIYPKSKYEEILDKFKEARKNTGLFYSFPGRGGDCNCATWPAKIGIPIPSPNGIMKIYIQSISNNDIRQMGACVDK